MGARESEARLSRKNYVLAVLSAGNGKGFQPVHVQKLFFLIDRELKDLIGKQYFHFEPYDYGPFDKELYSVLDCLEEKGLVEVARTPNLSKREYRLTVSGQKKGVEVFTRLDPKVRKGIMILTDFVLKQPFAKLVAAIYKKYPEMKVNSIFAC